MFFCDIINYVTIHPFIFHCLSGVGSWGQQTKQGSPLSPSTSSSSSGGIVEGRVLKTSPGTFMRAILTSCPNHFIWFLLDRRSSSPTLSFSRMAECLTTSLRENPAHFSLFYPHSRSFGHYLKFVTICEGRNKNRPVNRELCLSAQLPPQQISAKLASLQTPHQSTRSSAASISPNSWTRPQGTWAPPLGGRSTPRPGEGTPPFFPAEKHVLKFGSADSHPGRFTLGCKPL